MQIADRTVASFHYTLTDDAGQVIDSSSGNEPLSYLHGVGNIVPVSVAITGIYGDEVTVDGNHPLAGKTLHFKVEITDVREATVEECVHGHVHGAGGHHH